MTTTHAFDTTGIIILAIWVIALVGYIPAVHRRMRWTVSAVPLLIGWTYLAWYLGAQWVALGHPPMRNISQTMLWAAFFLPLITLGIELFAKTRIQAIPAIIVGSAFVIGVIKKGEVPNAMLPPALQSPWFAPHVLVYMIAYAAICVAAVLALVHLVTPLARTLRAESDAIGVTRLLMRIAYPLLTLGMLLGAYWGKIAWGTYWGWDSKETAAFVSWTSMLIYTHLDYRGKLSPRWNMGLALITGLMILFAWMLINFLPSAKSLHTYAN
jgi:ABC-type transport system involved in cytochrome c biogenesis permease subunit